MRSEPTRTVRKDGTVNVSHGPASGIPARGTGTRPPFAPGNTCLLYTSPSPRD